MDDVIQEGPFKIPAFVPSKRARGEDFILFYFGRIGTVEGTGLISMDR